MDDKKLRDIPGVGHVTEQILNGLGIYISKDIEEHLVEIFINFSEAFFEFITKSSMGISRILHDKD
jgi:hypothetical protein